jgi:hypothetical protein
MPQVPKLAELDPIRLWLLIHGGDPAPDERVGRLTSSLAIHSLASHLSTDAAKQIRVAVGKEIAAAARAFEKA